MNFRNQKIGKLVRLGFVIGALAPSCALAAGGAFGGFARPGSSGSGGISASAASAALASMTAAVTAAQSPTLTAGSTFLHSGVYLEPVALKMPQKVPPS